MRCLCQIDERKERGYLMLLLTFGVRTKKHKNMRGRKTKPSIVHSVSELGLYVTQRRLG